MEEDKENSSPNSDIVFTSLKLHNGLKMSREQVYCHIEKYQLCPTELLKNRFPVAGTAANTLVSSIGAVNRKCFRCLQHFAVSLSGSYFNMEKCLYHPQRKLVVASNQGRVHLCCRRPPGSLGCTTFPVHVCGDPILHDVVYQSIKEKSNQLRGVYALDCEMVYTAVGQQVAKIGLVDIDGSTVLERYIQPDNQVVDYCTTFSGITPNNLKGVTTTLRDIQVYLDKILNHDSILIGHALENDLRALRLSHNKIVDTSVLFPRPNGTKYKLKDLARDHLNLVIQSDSNGHSCIEDARTCMALVLHKIKTDKKLIADYSNRDSNIQNPNLTSCNQTIHFGQVPTYESPYVLGCAI